MMNQPKMQGQPKGQVPTAIEELEKEIELLGQLYQDAQTTLGYFTASKPLPPPQGVEPRESISPILDDIDRLISKLRQYRGMLVSLIGEVVP